MTLRTAPALLLPAMLCLGALESAAQLPDAGTIYVVTYVELKPTASADAVSLLKAYRDALRGGEGNLRSEVLRHTSRRGQFVVLSAWKDQKAFEAQRDAARNKELREKLQALRNSPTDDRVHTALSVGADGGSRATGGLNIVTHVDVVPPRKDDAVALLKALGDASRGEDGNLRYEVVQQTNRPNHFTVIESWKSREAFEAHGMARHVREFRDKLAPMSGALYDERLYERLI